MGALSFFATTFDWSKSVQPDFFSLDQRIKKWLSTKTSYRLDENEFFSFTHMRAKSHSFNLFFVLKMEKCYLLLLFSVEHKTKFHFYEGDWLNLIGDRLWHSFEMLDNGWDARIASHFEWCSHFSLIPLLTFRSSFAPGLNQSFCYHMKCTFLVLLLSAIKTFEYDRNKKKVNTHTRLSDGIHSSIYFFYQRRQWWFNSR